MVDRRFAFSLMALLLAITVMAPTTSAANEASQLPEMPGVGHLKLANAQAVPARVTVTVSTSFIEPQNTAGVLLTGFSATNSNEPTLLALTWTQEDSGWFPTWELQLHSAIGLLPQMSTGGQEPGDSKEPGGPKEPGGSKEPGGKEPGDSAGAGYVRLSDLTPIAGHTYEVSTSYAAEIGALSICVSDTTTNEVLYRDGLVLPQYNGALSAVTGAVVDESRSKVGDVHILRISAGYVPLGTDWAPGKMIGNPASMIPTQLFDSQDQAGVIQLTVPGIAPKGVFRFAGKNNDNSVEIAQFGVLSRQSLIPLPVSNLPIGKSLLLMQYLENGEVLLSDERPIVVGNVTAQFATPRVDLGRKLILSELQLRSRDAMFGITVNVTATLLHSEWDSQKREFKEVTYAENIAVFNGKVDLPDDELATVPLQLALPDMAGTWRVKFALQISPDVKVTVTEIEHVFSSYPPASISVDQPFSFVVLPDTQFMTQKYPQVYMRMMQWIAENTHAQKTALVLGVGDITQGNAPTEWEQARQGFDLLRGVAPYIISVGDHDMVQGSVQRGVSLVNQYFRPNEFPSLAGQYKSGDLGNAYYKLQIAGNRFLIISLEFAPPDEVVEWANRIVEENPDDKVIVLTHAYGNGLAQPISYGVLKNVYSMANDATTTMNEGMDLWVKFVRKHANIVMTISGHTGSIELPYYVAVGDHKNRILQLMVNWQGEEFGGNGWLAMLTFNPDQTLEARVYSPYLGRFKTEIGKYGFTNHFLVYMKTMAVKDLLN